MKEHKRVKAEFIIMIDGKPDIMGGYPVKERKELVRCNGCRHSVQLDDSNYFVCGKPFASNRETHTADWFCADAEKKGERK